MPSPVVSVVLPTRNRAQLLRRAVQSVLAQSFADLELIVVDDASSDETPELLRAFQDPRLRVIRREHNRGAAAARNAGIREARGEFLAFQDDDDEWLVCKLERQLGAMRNASADVALCLCGSIALHRHAVEYVGGEWYFRQIDFSNGGGHSSGRFEMIATPGWLLRRSAIDAVGDFDERMRSYDDWELALRIWKVARLTYVSEPLWIQDWRRTTTGLAGNEPAHAHDLEIIIDKHRDVWTDRPDAMGRHCYIIGRNYVATSSPAKGRAWLRKSIAYAPWKPKTWLVLLLSFIGPHRYSQLTQRVRSLRLMFRREW